MPTLKFVNLPKNWKFNEYQLKDSDFVIDLYNIYRKYNTILSIDTITNNISRVPLTKDILVKNLLCPMFVTKIYRSLRKSP